MQGIVTAYVKENLPYKIVTWGVGVVVRSTQHLRCMFFSVVYPCQHPCAGSWSYGSLLADPPLSEFDSASATPTMQAIGL